jgi:hypothetical protein
MLLATFFVAGSLVWHMPLLLECCWKVAGFEFRRILYPTIYPKMNHNSDGFYSGNDVGFLPALCIAFAAIVAHTMQRVTLKQICNVASLAQICNVASLAQQCSKVTSMHTCRSSHFSHTWRAKTSNDRSAAWPPEQAMHTTQYRMNTICMNTIYVVWCEVCCHDYNTISRWHHHCLWHGSTCGRLRLNHQIDMEYKEYSIFINGCMHGQSIAYDGQAPSDIMHGHNTRQAHPIHNKQQATCNVLARRL